MTQAGIPEIRVGDIIESRKPHPCGSSEWTVTRTGADIKMRCNRCGRVVMLEREVFLRRRKRLITPGPETGAPGFLQSSVEYDILNNDSKEGKDR